MGVKVRPKFAIVLALALAVLVLASCSAESASQTETTVATDTTVGTDTIVGEAVRRFCAEQFDCASPATLYVVSAYIDSNTGLGNEVGIEDTTREAIEAAIGRPFQWLESPSEVDAAVEETPSPTILTIGEPVFFQYVAEVDVGWSRRPLDGKRVTMAVDLSNQDNGDTQTQTPRTTSVP